MPERTPPVSGSTPPPFAGVRITRNAAGRVHEVEVFALGSDERLTGPPLARLPLTSVTETLGVCELGIVTLGLHSFHVEIVTVD